MGVMGVIYPPAQMLGLFVPAHQKDPCQLLLPSDLLLGVMCPPLCHPHPLCPPLNRGIQDPQQAILCNFGAPIPLISSHGITKPPKPLLSPCLIKDSFL